MTIPTAGGPWTALLLIGVIVCLTLTTTPLVASAHFRRRRTARAVAYWHAHRDQPLTDQQAARLGRMLRP